MTMAFRIIFLLILAVAVVPAPIKAMNPRKLDDTTPTTTNPVGSPDDQVKCGSCPCGTTCDSSPPPPPPPSPSPPPPPPYPYLSPPPPYPYLSPPPPPKKPSPTPGLKCPPPPSGGGGGGGSGQAPPDYIYITGPPGDLYPVVQSVSAARRSFTVAPPLLVLSGLLGMLAFW